MEKGNWKNLSCWKEFEAVQVEEFGSRIFWTDVAGHLIELPADWLRHAAEKQEELRRKPAEHIAGNGMNLVCPALNHLRSFPRKRESRGRELGQRTGSPLARGRTEWEANFRSSRFRRQPWRLPLFNRPDRFPDRILQAVQAPAHVGFGLPVALLLVVELLAKLLDRHRAADRAPEGAVGLRLALEQCAVRQRNPRSRGEHARCWLEPDKFGLGFGLDLGLGLRAGRVAQPQSQRHSGLPPHPPHARPSGRQTLTTSLDI